MKNWGRIVQGSALGLVLLLILGAGNVLAVTKTAVTSGNWSSSAVWSPAGAPAFNDIIVINSGVTVTVDVNTAIVQSFTIQSGGVLQGDGTGKIVTYGKGGGEDFTNNGTLNAAGANAMTLLLNKTSMWGGTGVYNISYLNVANRALNFTLGATLDIGLDGAGDPFIATTGSVNPTATVTFTYNGTSPQVISSIANINYHNIVVTNASGVTLAKNLTATNFTGNLTVSGGGVLNTADGTSSFSITGTAGNTLTLAAGSTLNIGSGTTTASSFPTGFTTFALDEASNVIYSNNSTAAQTVSVAPTYGNLTLAGSTAKTVATGTLTLLGDWTNNSTGAVTFTAPQTVAFGAAATSGRTIGGSTATSFNSVTVGNAAGVTLGTNATVGGTLSLGANKITTGANVLAIGAAGSVSRTTGYVNGNLSKNAPAGAPSVNFEIGDASTYAPVNLSFTGVTSPGTITANTTPGDHPSLASSTIDPSKSANRYWTLSNSGVVFTSYAATLNFAAGDLDAGANTSNFVANEYNGTWSAPSVGARTSTSTQATGLTAFGDFAVGESFTYTITASAGANGSITPSGAVSVPPGNSQTFTITANTGYHVADVLVDGVSVGAVASYPFNGVAANHTIDASFAIDVFTVTASAGANGTIAPLGATPVNYGGSQSYTITPDAGYHVADILVDGVSVGAVTSYPFSNVTANHTIDASFAIDVFTITASAGANGTIAPSGATPVNYGGSQSYAITPDAGHHVADVLVDGVSVGAVTSYPFTNVTTNHTIAASFAIDTFSIAATSGANGTVTPAGTTVVNYGGSQTYTIAPDAGYHVADVLVDGASVGAVTSYPFTSVSANHTISASFAIDTFAISASAGANGSIAPSGVTSITYGGSQTYTMTPAANYHVADVLVDGVSVGAVTSYPFTNVTANHTISVSFAIDAFTITASSGANGTVTPAGVTGVSFGGDLAYTITPSTGYHVADVLVDGSSVGAVTSYPFTNVTANHTISASFAIDSFAISASAGAHGAIAPVGVTNVAYGGSQSYTITPDTGYHILDVMVDGVSVGAVTSYPFTSVAANHSIVASFSIDTYDITATAHAGGTISPSGVVTVNLGSDQGFTITPNTGFFIADVHVDTASVGAVASYNFTNVTANHTIQAFFDTLKYTITASSGGHGTISPSGPTSVNYDGGHTFTMTPDTGYHVADVLVDGVSVGAVASYPFTNVTANHTISVSFAIDAFAITASAGAHGAINPSGVIGVNYGASQAFSITADTGYFISDVHVDTVSVGAVSSYNFTNVTANHTIHASFDTLKYTITASAGPHGTISPSGARTVIYGDTVAYTITPDAGYFISDLQVDSVSVGVLHTYAFNHVTANHTIHALFVANTPPSATHLLAPANGDTLALSSASDSIAFTWMHSADPDLNDTVSYAIHVWGVGVDTSVAGLSDTTLAMKFPGIQQGQRYRWTVVSTDGDTTVASADTFAFHVDFPTGVHETKGLPQVYALHQNYPNPFNPSTMIKFDLPAASLVTLKVYNLLGQEVRTLIDGQSLSAGYQELRFDASTLPSGVYLYRISAKGMTENPFTSVKKMVLIK